MIIIPVAMPLLLNTACRKGTITNKATTAIKLSLPNCVAVNFFLFDNPNCLGNKLVVAIGQSFLQIPTATTNI